MAAPRKGFRTCAKCKRNRADRFYKTDRGRVCTTCQKKRAYNGAKDIRLQDTYGISLADYYDILDSQGGVCAICRGRRPVYDVDHDHARERALRETGLADGEAARLSVRGLCCRRCNRRLLPACLDDVGILHSAVAYLERPPAHAVLHAADPEPE